MAKYYFKNKNSEMCYDLDYHLDYMQKNNLSEMDLFEAKIVYGTDFFYCKYFDLVCEKKLGTCGKQCEKYSPRNKKSGICKYYCYVYENTDKIKTIKLKLKKYENNIQK